jgi:hypothetical protein
MPSGGYRQPNNPAPVSGPGALSQRTDGGATEGMTQPAQYISGLGYGKGKETYDMQTAAPMQGSDIPVMPTPTAVPLSAPTQRPEEPVTSGIDMGAGPGSEAIRPLNTAFSPSHTVKQIAQYDPTGEAELLFRVLSDRGL